MSDTHAVHRQARNKHGKIRLWVIEEKVGGVWVRARIHRGQDGPKVSRGQRVRRLKGKELRDSQAEGRKIPMSNEEIRDTLGW